MSPLEQQAQTQTHRDDFLPAVSQFRFSLSAAEHSYASAQVYFKLIKMIQAPQQKTQTENSLQPASRPLAE